VVLKFWLNVSAEEQRQRFPVRLNTPGKYWKYATGDVRGRAHWDDCMAAYEAALHATARPWAPGYAIQADSRSYMRMCVADIVVRTLRSLDLHYPEVAGEECSHFDEMRCLCRSPRHGTSQSSRGALDIPTCSGTILAC